MCDTTQTCSNSNNSSSVASVASGGTDTAFSSGQQLTDIDLSYLQLDTVPQHYVKESQHYSPLKIRSLSLHHNRFSILDGLTIYRFHNLLAIDISNNLLADFPDALCELSCLRFLIAKNNQLNSTSMPKSMCGLRSLQVLNVSGNNFEEFPPQFCEIPALQTLYMGGNRLRSLPCCIGDMTSLEVLYLGGNNLRDIPATIGRLKNITSLVLCDNKLETIPSTIANLRRLHSLNLHNNCLRTLPTEIATLPQLQELSLRGNPLVVRFVRDITFDPPSLKELAARVTKIKSLPYGPLDVPTCLMHYLETAHHCVNPKCKGVYFEARIEHVKFVDFCGKYRVPLMQYLCSPRCSDIPAYAVTDSSGDSDGEDDLPAGKLRKILLG